MGEHGRIFGSLFAHESLKNLEIELPNQPLPSLGHQEVDKSFATNYTPIFANSEKSEFQTLVYQTRGEQALNAGFWILLFTILERSLNQIQQLRSPI